MTLAAEMSKDCHRVSSRDETTFAFSGPQEQLPTPNCSLISFLEQNAAEFVQLSKLRRMGWSNPQGDAFFRNQRELADTADHHLSRIFYNMMQKIGEQLQAATNGFSIAPSSTNQPKILDFCMAPGGFLATALEQNPSSQALAFTLPVSLQGHKVLLPPDKRVTRKYLDITMLAADMGFTDVPAEHHDAQNFYMQQEIGSDELFDLIICDGQVLRQHPRASYREKREARRLALTQMVLGLQHVRPGGTMIVLLHKAEAWGTFSMLSVFDRFSTIRLFKPKPQHAKRSSFYMLATDIQPARPEAISAVEKWKHIWQVATFDTDEAFERAIHVDDSHKEHVVKEFGGKFVDLAREIWVIQADALSRAPFMKAK